MKLLKIMSICTVIGFSAAPSFAQYGDPFRCMAPTGQQLFEIAAMNVTRAYREDPTPAKKATMCTSHKKVVKVYKDAVQACSQSNCDEVHFLERCGVKSEKLQQWQENTAIACGVK